MSKVRISSDEFERHRKAIVERYQHLGCVHVEVREEKRGEDLYCNLVGMNVSFEGALEVVKSTVFPLEMDAELLDR